MLLNENVGALFGPPPPGAGIGSQIRIGTLVSFDASTGHNQVNVSGGVLTDVPVLYNGSGAQYAVGQRVALMVIGNTYLIMGSMQVPGSMVQAVNTATVAAGDATTAQTWGDLAVSSGPSVTAYVSGARRVMVTLSALVENAAGSVAQMGVQVSGSSQIAPSVLNALTVGNGAVSGDTFVNASLTFPLTHNEGLNEGMATFTAKYQGGPGAPYASFTNRRITVVPY